MIITDNSRTAFEKVSMDVLGPLPVTQTLNEYILTIQDNFTEYLLAISLPNFLVSTIADVPVKKMYMYFRITQTSSY